jgi:hypothetical protein
MEIHAGRAENIAASLTGFSVRLAQFNPRRLLAGVSLGKGMRQQPPDAVRGCSQPFPVSQSRQFINNFQQSLEPPFLLGCCGSVFPANRDAVCLTNISYLLPDRLNTL